MDKAYIVSFDIEFPLIAKNKNDGIEKARLIGETIKDIIKLNNNCSKLKMDGDLVCFKGDKAKYLYNFIINNKMEDVIDEKIQH